MPQTVITAAPGQSAKTATNGHALPGPEAMLIERIETVPLRVPLGRVYRGSYYHMTHRSTIVVRVHTSAGIVGEVFVADEDENNAAIDRVIHDEVFPKIKGEDGSRTQRIWSLTRPVTFNILRDRRIGLVAQAGVDAALWDAIGKLYGQPLWKLWGGFRTRSR